MNEYERMLSDTQFFTSDFGDDLGDFLYHRKEMEEQLFAEYLMEAGMLPCKYDVYESCDTRYAYVRYWYEGELEYSIFYQPKPGYWK